jgi:pimeloyl-ACP methyl ester carboxylesterase
MQKFIEYRGVKVAYADSGEGPCLVLLHGYLESGEIWHGFVDQFPGGYRFIVPDLPGHGASGTWGKVHRMDDLAGAVMAILQAEGIGKIVLAGHSMGGYVTMAFAALYPEKLLAYSLVHSTSYADTKEKRDLREREISLVMCGKKRQIVLLNIPKAFSMDNLEHFTEEVEQAKQIAIRNPDEGIIALLNGMKERHDLTSVLQSPGLPLLLIGGVKDNYIPIEVFEKLVKLAPHATVLRLEESGHMGFIEEPERVARAMMEMLQITSE